MASPFPGMDPYLETWAFWPDFHSTFINAWCEAIADGLPDEHDARLGERPYAPEADPEIRRLMNANTHVPLEIIDRPRELFVKLMHRGDRSLVAVLELLSLATKENPGRTEYLSKRNEILRPDVHLVELDLLLGGQRLPSPRPLPAADYYYLIARAEQRPACQVYPWKLPNRLPRLPVPLRPQHADVMIDLAQVFATALQRGRYSRSLRYDRPCPVPLSEGQRAWAETIIASAVGK